jgi:signal transduction histidine kinase
LRRNGEVIAFAQISYKDLDASSTESLLLRVCSGCTANENALTPSNAPSAKQRAREPGMWWLTAALVSPFLVVVTLLWQARRGEESRRVTEERVLADYGAIAVRHVLDGADGALHMRQLVPGFDILTQARGHKEHEHTSPAVLLRHRGDSMAPSLLRHARTAFRLEVPGRALAIAGEPYTDEERESIITHILAVAADTMNEPHRLVVDSTAGRVRLFALWLARGHRPEMPQTIYGIESSVSAVGEVFEDILRTQPLLYSSLVEPPYTTATIRVGVSTAKGTLVWQNGSDSLAIPRATDTLPPYLGGLQVHVSPGPQLATALRMGRLPKLYVPLLIGLLVLSLTLAALAVVQVGRAREVARLRQQFVANVSHELRTPLTQVSMFAEMLAEGRVRSDAERTHYARVIQRESKRLATLVAGVLRFSRQQHGGLNRERVDLRSEVDDAVQFFSPIAKGSSRIFVDGARDLITNADRDAVRQMLFNLLDNAAKYGPDGQRITITTQREGPDVVITVIDQGSGIPPGDRKRVFEPYVRLDRVGAPARAGAGIGLSLVSDLVSAHGGRVWIADGPGGGTAVSFTIPSIP